jgi:hypothetical protein
VGSDCQGDPREVFYSLTPELTTASKITSIQKFARPLESSIEAYQNILDDSSNN